jgi:hypothetical protein
LQPRNMVFIATEENNVYAFDADSLAPVWQVNLGANDQTKVGSPGCDSISVDGIGIEATPVIDPISQRMFVSYRVNTDQNLDGAQQFVAAFDIRTGKRVLGPTEIHAPGFLPRWERNRASLLLVNGVVYVAFASRCEDPGQPIFHGYVVAIDASTLMQSAVYNVTDNDVDGGGVWQASSGLASDGRDIYFMSGNRRFGVDQRPIGYSNLADSIVRIHPQFREVGPGHGAFSMSLADWFTPYRKLWMDSVDLDLGSAGPVLIPGTQYLIGGGKQGWLYILNEENMGKLDPEKSWSGANLQTLHPDSTSDQFPEDLSADRVVQKFQAGFNQYIPAQPNYLAPPGAPVATAVQSGNLLDLFNVGRDGAVYVTWQEPSGQWSDGMNGDPYAAATTPPITKPGAHLATAQQGSNQLDVFVVGNDGAVYVTSVAGTGRWTDGTPGNLSPQSITPTGMAPTGACLTTAYQTDQQLDVFFVGNDGGVYVTWVTGTGPWSDGNPGNAQPARITPMRFAVPGTCVAAARQSANQLDVFVVNQNDRSVWVTWVTGTGAWTDGMPGHGSAVRITTQQLVDPQAPIVAANQTARQLDVFVPGLDGGVYVTSAGASAAWADGKPGDASPALITPQHVTSPTGSLSVAQQTATQLDVFYVDPKSGTVMVTWVSGTGKWSDGTPGNAAPATASTAFTTVNASTAASAARAGELQVFAIGNDGGPWVTKVVGTGAWTDGGAGHGGPQELTRAIWMSDWPNWPHIHGSPVVAMFKDGSVRIYVWPEKDHLRSWAWAGAAVDLNSMLQGADAQGNLILDPDGMPGGMLELAVDPNAARSGVLFASLTQTGETDGPGILRAFDAVTLKEIWNNKGENYMFSKFVPPTIANNRVFLPTCSNKVLVYGRN